jgi:hypothetical protein
VTEETLSATIEIPLCDETWSKGMPLDVICYEDFIKLDCLNGKVEVGIPSRYLHEPFQNLLGAIRKYFTCEGRYDIIHPHHIKLFIHFTGRSSLNLPFFLHQSLREMVDNIQAEANQTKKKLSHISLIKLLIVEVLRQLGENWDSFILTVNIPRDPKGDSPLPAGKVTYHHVKEEIGRVVEEGNTLEALSPQQPIPLKRGMPRKKNRSGRPKPQASCAQIQPPKSYSCAPFGWNLSKVHIEKPLVDREGKTLKESIFMNRRNN